MKSEKESYDFTDKYSGEERNDAEDLRLVSSVSSISREFPETGIILPYSACLIDRSGRQYVCFHDHCEKHSSCFKNEARDEISDFQALHLHPEDKARLCDKVLPDILKFMDAIPVSGLSDYRFTFNHRYIRKDESISQFLQEGTLSVSEDKNLPVLNLRVFTEIGDFKTDETMILSIFRYSAEQGYQKVWTKVYDNGETSQLSRREMEIIRLCLEGLSSKMIADKLSLSIHTVKNHKRNCMEKTLTHNITELINLCIRSHWL